LAVTNNLPYYDTALFTTIKSLKFWPPKGKRNVSALLKFDNIAVSNTNLK
jgi:hypothetical protein